MKGLMICLVILFLIFSCVGSLFLFGKLLPQEPFPPGPTRIPSSVIFEEEKSANVGSYEVGRINEGVSWTELSQWTTLTHFVSGGREICFGYFNPGKNPIFRAKSGYEWVKVIQIRNNERRECLKLVRK